MAALEITSFSHQSKEDRRLLKRFVRFHRDHYGQSENFVPLLDYEYLGFKLLGLTGFFEPDNLFFKHGRIRFFLAEREGRTLGRVCAYVNDNHNEYWKERTGFFGHFECIEDGEVSNALIDAAAGWLVAQGMEMIRGPQNFPANEATPGLMIDGFGSRPIIYYDYSKPYYRELLKESGFDLIKRIYSWEVPVDRPMEEKLDRVARMVQKRGRVVLEKWRDRSLEVRKREMHLIYNEAWKDNFGFVPFTFEEFSHIIDEMQLIMNKDLFVFAYVDGEPAGFFGGVPNILENMELRGLAGRIELLRALKMLLGARRTKGFRLGYLGVRDRYRKFGLEGYLLWNQKVYAQSQGHWDYTDIGWILEDNESTIRLVHMMKDVRLSKTYGIFEKVLSR